MNEILGDASQRNNKKEKKRRFYQNLELTFLFKRNLVFLLLYGKLY